MPSRPASPPNSPRAPRKVGLIAITRSVIGSPSDRSSARRKKKKKKKKKKIHDNQPKGILACYLARPPQPTHLPTLKGEPRVRVFLDRVLGPLRVKDLGPRPVHIRPNLSAGKKGEVKGGGGAKG